MQAQASRLGGPIRTHCFPVRALFAQCTPKHVISLQSNRHLRFEARDFPSSKCMTLCAASPGPNGSVVSSSASQSTLKQWSYCILGAAVIVMTTIFGPVHVASARPEGQSRSETRLAATVEKWQDTGIMLAESKQSKKVHSKLKEAGVLTDEPGNPNYPPQFRQSSVEPSYDPERRSAEEEESTTIEAGQLGDWTYRWLDKNVLPKTEIGAALRRLIRRPMNNTRKQGRLITNPGKSLVRDLREIPQGNDAQLMEQLKVGEGRAETANFISKMGKLTYTQFWKLIRERKIERVVYTADRRAVNVTTKNTAPMGKRTDTIVLPYDPDLFNHMVTHGVIIEEQPTTILTPILVSLLRMLMPILISVWCIQLVFRWGTKKERDKIFGNTRLQILRRPDQLKYSFKDIAGVDQVKDELNEIVYFLRNPRKFLKLGARAPAGVLLTGPPGTGKTLLARAVAGEARVPFFSTSGSEYMEYYVGVGASRLREVFQAARKSAPCILFIDEFDGVGKARGTTEASDEESVHTVNQLLTELDGFDDNTGVVVMAATNRPEALDTALTRPGRFDRIIKMPMPNVDGRVEILKVHSRDRPVDPNLDYRRIARATAGMTGAQLMNVMNTASILAGRMRLDVIDDDVVFGALDKIMSEKNQAKVWANDIAGKIPDFLRKRIAFYEAARVLVAYISPDHDEIMRVNVCPNGKGTASTFFLPSEERLETHVVRRGYFESQMVVSLAGRCAEKLVYGEGQLSGQSRTDVRRANAVAKEMVLRLGYSKKLGPVALMGVNEGYLKSTKGKKTLDMSTEIARIAYSEMKELLLAAEAKAYYGLAVNYEALQVLTEHFVENELTTGKDLDAVLEKVGVTKFQSETMEGFGWAADGSLIWPGRPKESVPEKALASANGDGAAQNGNVPWWSARNPYQVRSDIAELLSDL